MKKLIIIPVLVTFIFGTGCKDYLDEDITGQIVGDAPVKSQAGLEGNLTGAYKALGNPWGTGFLHPTAIAVSAGGEDVTTMAGGNKEEFKQYDVFAVANTNGRGNAIYNGCYKTIQQTNLILANYQTATGVASTINVIAGEAYFLRALSYYWLVRMYKDIPFVKTYDFSFDYLKMEKTGPAEIYAQIVSDFQQAEQLLPDKKRDAGRPNAGSAKAFLADVYLTMAGWPIKDASKYALAAAKAKEVIDNKDKYGFKFLPTFAEVFENDPTKNGTAEDIFLISANNANGSTLNACYGYSAMPAECTGGWDDFFAELGFYKSFPAGPRKAATFAEQYPDKDGKMLTWQQLATKHPYYLKFWIKSTDPGWLNYRSSLPYPMMRYAHVLTIYAEAMARSNGPDQLAYDCINAIRTRAGLSTFSDLSASAFADSVVQERAWEFAGERTRWFDLVRLEKVAEANSHKDPNENNMPTHTPTEADYTFPIPVGDTNINPNLN